MCTVISLCCRTKLVLWVRLQDLDEGHPSTWTPLRYLYSTERHILSSSFMQELSVCWCTWSETGKPCRPVSEDLSCLPRLLTQLQLQNTSSTYCIRGALQEPDNLNSAEPSHTSGLWSVVLHWCISYLLSCVPVNLSFLCCRTCNKLLEILPALLHTHQDYQRWS